MAATSSDERNLAFSVQAAIWPFFGFVGNLVGGLLPGLFAFLLGVTSTQAAPYRLALLLASAINFLAVLAIWQMEEVAATPVAATQAQSNGSALPWRVIGVVALISCYAPVASTPCASSLASIWIVCWRRQQP